MTVTLEDLDVPGTLVCISPDDNTMVHWGDFVGSEACLDLWRKGLMGAVFLHNRNGRPQAGEALLVLEPWRKFTTSVDYYSVKMLYKEKVVWAVSNTFCHRNMWRHQQSAATLVDIFLGGFDLISPPSCAIG